MTPTTEPRPIEHVARLKIDGMRLDLYLAGCLAEVSRSTIQRVIESGGVTVNGKVAKASYKVRHGDVIVITPPEPERPAPHPENIPLDVLYEDEFLAVINKRDTGRARWSTRCASTFPTSADSTATTGPASSTGSTAIRPA
jgi:23S rRNA-/tRNA-specific pseudouridylate synthase